MDERFDNTRQLLSPTGGSAWLGKLLAWAGCEEASEDWPTLVVLDAALLCAERHPEPPDDGSGLAQLGCLDNQWGVRDPDRWNMRPGSIPIAIAVAECATEYLNTLPPGQLRLTAAMLGIEILHLNFAIVGQVKIAFREDRPEDVPAWALTAVRQGEELDYGEMDAQALERQEPQDWSPLNRAALTAAVVWKTGELVALADELADSAPRQTVPWQTTIEGHVSGAATVPLLGKPGRDVTALAKISPRPSDTRLLWRQAPPTWVWEIGWDNYETAEFIRYKAGGAPSLMLAQWRAERALEHMLRKPKYVRCSMTGARLVPSSVDDADRKALAEMIKKVADLHAAIGLDGAEDGYSPDEVEAAWKVVETCGRDQIELHFVDHDEWVQLKEVYTRHLEELAQR